MQYRKLTSTRIGRKNHLAQALALALTLGGGVAITATAQPVSPDQGQPVSAAELQARQALAERHALQAANEARANAKTAGTTRYVANCNDSGPGSLRYYVGIANSGDTIDMSTLPCHSISLSNALIVNQNDLDLLGWHQGNDRTTIHGTVRVINHTGTGDFRLLNLDIQHGRVYTSGQGACIFSSGSVRLFRTRIHDCIAKRAAGVTTPVQGGAIYAAGEVELKEFSEIYDSKAIATAGNAYGGGIWAGDWVQIKNRSKVYNNIVETTSGKTYGGGIYGKDWVDVTGYSDIVGNSAVVHGSYTQSKGTGIYTERYSYLNHADIDDNIVIYPPGGSTQYIGEGVGIYAEDGVDATRTRIRGNEGGNSSGGGIFTNGYLTLDIATVADNYGLGTGAIFARGNATIRNSTISGNRSRDTANIKLGPEATRDIFIRNSTISGNSITNNSTNGAALNLQHDATIQNSTITGNIEKNTTDTKYGAGISLDSNVNVDLKSTIVAPNYIDKAAGGLVASDINEARGASGATITGDHNLIMVSGVTPVPVDTIQLQAPLLGPLADNGGPTRTHAPCKDSPVFESGDADSSVLYDQRGEGFPRLEGGSVDIGAIESPDYRDIIFRNSFEEGECGS